MRCQVTQKRQGDMYILLRHHPASGVFPHSVSQVFEFMTQILIRPTGQKAPDTGFIDHFKGWFGSSGAQGVVFKITFKRFN